MRALTITVSRSSRLCRRSPLALIAFTIVTAGVALQSQGDPTAGRSRLWVHGTDLRSAQNAMVFLSALSISASTNQEPILGYSPLVLSPSAVQVFVDDADVGAVKVTGFEQSPVGLDVVLAIDVSGSVYSNYEFVKRGMGAFVDRRREGKDQIAIVAFGSDVNVSQFPSASGSSPFTGDVAVLKKFIDTAASEKMRGNTLFFRGAAQAVQTAARGRTDSDTVSLQKALLLFSDGHDTGTGFTLDETISGAKENGVQVFALGLPEAATQNKFHSNLERLAAESGGAFVTIGGLPRLEQVFARLDYLIKNENVLTFSIPRALADGNEHTLRIEARQGSDVLSTSIRIRSPRAPATGIPTRTETALPSLLLRSALGAGVVMSVAVLVVSGRTVFRYRQFERARKQNADALQSQTQSQGQTQTQV